MNQQLNDKIGRLNREVSTLNKKIEQQNDLIKRLTEQNARLQYDKREVVRISDQAFKLLGQIRSE